MIITVYFTTQVKYILFYIFLVLIIFIQGCAKAGKTTVANNTDTVIPCETAPTTEYLAPVYITDIISSDEYTAFIKSTGEYITVLKDKIRVSDAELVERDFTYAANLSLLSCVSVFGEKTQGSGVIYSIDGTKETAYIVTNYHIIYNREKKSVSNSIYVSLYSMSENNSANPSDYAIKAELIGGTAEYDIAVLKIKHPSLSDSVYSQIKLRQNEVSSGECVIAVGNPCGEGLSVTKGIISSVSEYINIDSPDGQGTVDRKSVV